MKTRHYSLISEEQKQATHLKIGNLLLQNTPIEQVDENIFDIVNQLNLGLTQIAHFNTTASGRVGTTHPTCRGSA